MSSLKRSAPLTQVMYAKLVAKWNMFDDLWEKHLSCIRSVVRHMLFLLNQQKWMPTCISTDFNRKHVCLKRDNKPKILAVPRTQKCFFFFFCNKTKTQSQCKLQKMDNKELGLQTNRPCTIVSLYHYIFCWADTLLVWISCINGNDSWWELWFGLIIGVSYISFLQE